MNINTNIQFIKGVGEVRAKLFNKLGIDDVGALLHFFPRSYVFWNRHKFLSETTPDIACCVKVRVESAVKQQITRSRMKIFTFFATDSKDSVRVTLFNTEFTAKKIKFGDTIVLCGNFNKNLAVYECSSPTICFDPNAPIQPIYSQTAGLTTNTIAKTISTALSVVELDDSLPKSIVEKYQLCDLSFALKNIHFPTSEKNLEIAKKRLIFQELFVLQVSLLFRKNKSENLNNFVISNSFTNQFFSCLPFKLTSSQVNVLNECLTDMSSGKQMRRLIQGDVGSGKTAVAAGLIYSTVKNGFQSVFMAPTEILAEQHFNTFSNLFFNSGINVALLTGSVTKSKKEKIKKQLSLGEIDLLVGTHAVLQDDVFFKNLALVVTDEQHRFGVEQRTKLSSKGNSPHILVMSATPIPRTLSLIVFGDLDISIIDTLPKGRQPIETYLIDNSKKLRAYNYIKKHLLEGQQGYIVCPAVEENEMSLISATEYFNQISKFEFKDFKTGLLHGKMSHKDKDDVMRRFSNKEIDLLVATTVIEVGIDVPNATIMLIENAENFGLSQLHQLRGRIGRGNKKSTCILACANSHHLNNDRLKTMCNTTNGFEIAATDLKLRGPGDFLGQRQHGLPELKIASLVDDINVLNLAGNAAKQLLEIDPLLASDDNSKLKDACNRLFKTVEKYDFN